MNNALEIVAAVLGLIYIWLEYRASVWLWVAGIVMPAAYVWIFFQEGVYANVAINAWFVLAAVWGLFSWLRGSAADKPITRMPRRVWPPALAVGAVLWVVIYWVLTRFTDGAIPLWDSFTTAYSVVGLWMLARKWAEQWLIWIVVDGTYTIMFAAQGMWPTSFMYFVFFVVAILGFFKWKRLS